MNVSEAFALALDPARALTAQGMTPDPWQRDVLRSRARYGRIRARALRGTPLLSSSARQPRLDAKFGEGYESGVLKVTTANSG